MQYALALDEAFGDLAKHNASLPRLVQEQTRSLFLTSTHEVDIRVMFDALPPHSLPAQGSIVLQRLSPRPLNRDGDRTAAWRERPPITATKIAIDECIVFARHERTF
jgi:hypothetical protein